MGAERGSAVETCEELFNAVRGVITEELRRSAHFDDIAVFHKDDLISDITGESHFVSNDDHSHTVVGEGSDDLEYLACKFGVESGGRLIEEEDLRFECEGAGDRNALLLTA